MGSKDRPGLLAKLASMAGTALMVLMALTVFEAILARRDRQARSVRQAQMAPWVRRDPPVDVDHLAYPGYQGPRVVPDRWDRQAHRVQQERRER
jgi:hypothetical protein